MSDGQRQAGPIRSTLLGASLVLVGVLGLPVPSEAAGAVGPPTLVMGGPADDEVHAFRSGPTGVSVAVGTFAGSWSQGPALTSHGGTDGFVVRVDGSLVAPSAIAVGGTGDDELWDAAWGSDGSLVVVGDFRGSISVGGRTLTSAGGSDALVIKYDPAGNVAWVRRAGGVGDERLRGVAVASDGEIAVVGDVTGGPSVWGTSVLAAAGGTDGVLARFTPTGGLWWARPLAGPGADGLASVTVGADGSFSAAGWFSATATAGTGATARSLTSAGATDAAVVTFARSGDLRWTARAGGAGVDLALGVTTTAGGNLYAVGGYTDAATVDAPATGPAPVLGAATLTGQGLDALALQVGPSGAFVAAAGQGGAGVDLATSIGPGPVGQLAVTGASTQSFEVRSSDGRCTSGFAVSSMADGWVSEVADAGGAAGSLPGAAHVLGSGSGVDLAWSANRATQAAGSFTASFVDLATGATWTSAGGDDVFVSATKSTSIACPIT